MPSSGQSPKPFHDDFSEFYREQSRGLLIFFTRRTYDAETAFDLTAETFAQALASRGRYRNQGEGSAEKWLHGIARNVLRRYLRKGRLDRSALERLRVDVPVVSDAEIERIEVLSGLDDLRTELAVAVGQLTSHHRTAIDLRIVRELSYPEVAAKLGVSEETARARVSRGLRKLAEHLDAPSIKEGRV